MKQKKGFTPKPETARRIAKKKKNRKINIIHLVYYLILKIIKKMKHNKLIAKINNNIYYITIN